MTLKKRQTTAKINQIKRPIKLSQRPSSKIDFVPIHTHNRKRTMIYRPESENNERHTNTRTHLTISRSCRSRKWNAHKTQRVWVSNKKVISRRIKGAGSSFLRDKGGPRAPNGDRSYHWTGLPTLAIFGIEVSAGGARVSWLSFLLELCLLF